MSRFTFLLLKNKFSLLHQSKYFSQSRRMQNSLLKQLQAKIKFSGPLTIHEYMKEVLTNPLSGYYMKKDEVFGSKGDFITSPEISQMFGELLGIWIYSEWHKMGAPKPFQLVEFGPGTGTLMQDTLRTLKQLQISNEDISVHLIERSLNLSNVQEERLCSSTSNQILNVPASLESHYKIATTTEGIPIYWHFDLSEVPKKFSMHIAHEFFDALPIHKLKKTNQGWREVLIDINPDGQNNLIDHVEELRYVISRGPTPASKLFVHPEETRDEIEVSPEAGIIMQELEVRLNENGGAALIIDYGHDGTLGDTFRAFRRHKQVSPLVDPGNSDLTSDVDFSSLKKPFENKLVCYGPVPQRFFLKNMGIEIRLQSLLQTCKANEHKGLISGYKMLVDPENMGERFKVMMLMPLVMKEILVQFPPVGFFNSFS